MTGETKKIVVVGDITIDMLQWEIKPEKEKKPEVTAESSNKSEKKEDSANKNGSQKNISYNWKLYPGYLLTAKPGGACLLADMVVGALTSNPKSNYQVISYNLEDQLDEPVEKIPPKEIIHSISILGEFNKKDDECDKNTVYRIKEFCGFSGPLGKPPKILDIKSDDPEVDMVIIDDAGNGFRDKPSAWPAAIKDDYDPLIVYKMSRPLVKGKLWEHLKNKKSGNLFVVVNANDLREMGVTISKKLSWERTSEDFIWQMTNNCLLNDLKDCNHLLVRLGTDGAIYYRNQNGKISADLYYDPKCMEDGYKDNTEGEMQGYGNAFVSALAEEIINEGFDCIEDGIINAIISARKLLDYGFGKTSEGGNPSEPDYPFNKIFGNKKEDYEENKNGKKCKCTDNKSIAHISIPTDFKKDSYWTILKSKNKLKLEDIAQSFVKYGFDSLKESNFGIPVGKFKGLRTVDRSEIESYQSIRNLMKEYIAKEDPKTPLCIAVFGPPGSGKSFGVNQLAKSIPDAKIKKIGFNVAQFKSQQDLIDALHKVRDEVLRGYVPLVFFDEFDAKYGENELGWLKYFLAPMQDCEFKSGESMHPIGKSIFVFAGGTSSNYEEFSRETLKIKLKTENLDENDKEQIEEKIDHFGDSKGTDFVSRLRGYVNIIGPNPGKKEDSLYIIRRAILLRSLLERKVKNIFNSDKVAKIDKEVLRAFLLCPDYKHGVRSMEAIIEMSMLTGQKKFEQSALPPASQLEMHVDSEKFLNIVERTVLFENEVRKLAEMSHKEYLQKQEILLPKEIIMDYLKENKIKIKPESEDKWLEIDDVDEFLTEVALESDVTKSSLKAHLDAKLPEVKENKKTLRPWKELEPNHKAYSIQQVRNIPKKLKAINYDFEPFMEDEPDEAKKVTFEDVDVEKLAEMEHARWMEQKINQGYVYGEETDDDKKINRYIVPWEELSENAKELDRRPVRSIPNLLFQVGFKVRKAV